jgi:hypothetical protein
MAKSRKFVNPFYALLIAAGMAFTVTACAFGVMTVYNLDPQRVVQSPQARHGLLAFLARHGTVLW